MTTNHTPGPWKKARNSSFWEVVTPFQGQLIDEANEFSPSVAYAWGCTEEVAEANAGLIAAAPELLEACKTFSEWLRREDEGFVEAGNKRYTPEGDAAWRDWYSENLRICALAQTQARAAIAKANGA